MKKITKKLFVWLLCIAMSIGMMETVPLSAEEPAEAAEPAEGPVLTYSAYVQDAGWQDAVPAGQIAGNEGLRMEAFSVSLEAEGYEDAGIEYRSHVSGIGWESAWRTGGEISGNPGEGRRIEALQMRLSGAVAEEYELYYCVYVDSMGWLGWAKDGAGSGSTGAGLAVRALCVTLLPKGSEAPAELGERGTAYYPKLTIQYTAHVQKIGWQGSVTNGQTAGTVGKSLRVEALKMHLKNGAPDSSVEYSSYVEGLGWESEWVCDDQASGTIGQRRQIEALRMALTGSAAEDYDIYYCVHISKLGWLSWAKNGEIAGAEGSGLKVEAFCVRIQPAGSKAPARMGSRSIPHYPEMTVRYSAHVSKVGWESYVDSPEVAGSETAGLQLEALKAALAENDVYPDSGIEYRSHVRSIGWESEWKSEGQVSGTTGRRLHVEAIEMRLTGSIANDYDLYYSVFVRNLGWTAWAKNGAPAGTSGGTRPIEAVSVKLVLKKAAVPANKGERTEAFSKLYGTTTGAKYINGKWYMLESGVVLYESTDSPLADFVLFSPHCDEAKADVIKKITIHHMAGDLSVETCGEMFAYSSREVSSNYGIGSDGRIGLYVPEHSRSWCSRNRANDNMAITIEVADDVYGTEEGGWHSSKAAMMSLIALCVDICVRNHIPYLTYTGDASGTLNKHCDVAATECPGDYIKSQMEWICEMVNTRLAALAGN